MVFFGESGGVAGHSLVQTCWEAGFVRGWGEHACAGLLLIHDGGHSGIQGPGVAERAKNGAVCGVPEVAFLDKGGRAISKGGGPPAEVLRELLVDDPGAACWVLSSDECFLLFMLCMQ